MVVLQLNFIYKSRCPEALVPPIQIRRAQRKLQSTNYMSSNNYLMMPLKKCTFMGRIRLNITFQELKHNIKRPVSVDTTDGYQYVNADGYFYTHAYSFSLTTVHILPTLLLVGQLGHLSFLTAKYLISSPIGLIPIQNSQQIRGYDYLKTYNPFKVFVAYKFCVTAKNVLYKLNILSIFLILKLYY